MREGCEVFLGKDVYCPGESIHGRVECNFSVEHKVRAIKVRFKGRSKVCWTEQRISHSADEKYFEKESDLLLSETDFPPGIYSYPFTYDLPSEIPSSMVDNYGNIKYMVDATIDRPLAVDYYCKKVFKVYLNHDFSAVDDLEKPVIFSEVKSPLTFFFDRAPIEIAVTLPRNGYFQNQMIAFTARIRNTSRIKVQGVRFKIVQGFKFMAGTEMKIHNAYKGQEFAIIDSIVKTRKENSWDLELRVPPNIFVGSLNHCRIIKVFWQLHGEVCLPFPYNNFVIYVPLILGGAPLA